MRIRHLSRTGAAALAAAAFACAAAAQRQAAGATVKSLSGAGSTLVAPLVAEWAQEFPVFYGVNIEYASVGSQAGLNRIASGATDFAATDSPLTTSEQAGLPELRSDPMDADGHRHRLSRQRRRQPAAADALGAGQHLSGPHHQMERQPHHLAQPRCQAARAEDHAGLHQRLGRHRGVHRVPVEGQLGMAHQGRHWRHGELPRRHHQQRQLGDDDPAPVHQRRHRLRGSAPTSSPTSSRRPRSRTRPATTRTPTSATSSRPGPPSRRFRPTGRWRSSTRPSPLPPPTRSRRSATSWSPRRPPPRARRPCATGSPSPSAAARSSARGWTSRPCRRWSPRPTGGLSAPSPPPKLRPAPAHTGPNELRPRPSREGRGR